MRIISYRKNLEQKPYTSGPTTSTTFRDYRLSPRVPAGAEDHRTVRGLRRLHRRDAAGAAHPLWRLDVQGGRGVGGWSGVEWWSVGVDGLSG